MPRFRLLIEYNGTRYSGWQMQRNARTVQGDLIEAVQKVTGRRDRLEVYGAGRTDAGVHALGQVAHLDVATTLPPATLLARLNEALPADINVLDVRTVGHRFHARHDAVGTPLRLPGQPAADRLLEALRLVGARATRRRGHAPRCGELRGPAGLRVVLG